MPAAFSNPSPAPIATAQESPATPTPRGTAADRLAEFEDCWKELTQEDRQWFAQCLTELLVDACQDAITSAR